MKPVDMRNVGDEEFLILWQDGTRSLYSNVFLQLNCRCASCVNEISGERMVKPSDIDPHVRIGGVEPVGNYGVKFKYSSGCRTGIYSFEYLYSLSQQQLESGQ